MTVRGKISCLFLGGLLSAYLLLPVKGPAEQIPKDWQQSFHKAKQALDNKKYWQTIEILDDYFKNKPATAHPLPYELLGNAWYRQGDFNKALEVFQKGFELNPRSFEVCCNLAIVAYELSDFKRAATSFEKASQLSEKTDGELLYQAALSYSKAGEKEEARRVLQELTGLREQMRRPWLQLAIRTDIELADWNWAEKHLAAYLESFNTEAANWKLLSRVYIKLKEYLLATVAMEIAHALEEPKNTDWKELASLYFSLDVPLQAVRCLEKAYGPNPSPAECEEMARGYARTHHLDRAIDFAQLAVKTEPTSSRYLLLGNMYYRLGSWSEAADALNASLQFKEADGLAYLLLGYSAIELGDMDAARLSFEKAEHCDAYRSQAKQAILALEQF